jgi:hypothetical protein
MSDQPAWLLVLLSLIGGGSVLGSFVAFLGTRQTSKIGIAANEQKARVDERAGDNMLIDQLQEELGRVRQGRDNAEAKYEEEHEYNEILRRRLWELEDWPPPPRPHDRRL